MNDPDRPHPSEIEDLTATRAHDGAAQPARSAPTELPVSIGRYRILGKLGEGGMGVVYEAEQQEPRRRVALKVVRGGRFVDESRLRMFQREAETLARLRHPNIGGIYEAGRTEDGQHYFAMELVAGTTLRDYLRSRPGLDRAGELRFRLGLFRKIVEAVHYAHQRGVIHRDIKPSNIVVGEVGSSSGESIASASGAGPALPEVKILDFGLARITEGDVYASRSTEIGMIKGTLPYMSPEQARGNPDEIDLRTDVYALGVVLYQMLTGRLPYDLERGSIVESVRVICQTEPRPLRSMIDFRLDPDVETIVAKTLEKDAARRYSSAAALDDDIGRYLASQPIAARPPSTAYQLRKFASRNRALVGGALATFVVLVAGIVVASVFGLREAAQRSEAQQARRDLEVVAEFQQRTLEQVSPANMGQGLFEDLVSRLDEALAAEGLDETRRTAALADFRQSLRRLNATDVAREALDRGVLEGAARAIETDLAGQPAVYARLNKVLGTTSFELGLYERSEVLLQRALTSYEEMDGGEVEAAGVRRAIGALLVFQGRFDEAEPQLRAAFETHRRLLGEDHLETLNDQSQLALLHREKLELEEAEALYADAVERRARVDGPDSEATLSERDGLAWIYVQQERYDEAEAIQRDVLERARRVFGERSKLYLTTLNNLAVNFVRQGRYAEAEPLYLEELAASRTTVGTEHRETHVSITNLGRLYLRMERFEEAERMLREAVEVGRLVVGPQEFGMGVALESYGLSLVGLDRHDEAESPLLEAWGILSPILGEEHRSPQTIARNLAEIYRRRGDEARAARWAAIVLEEG